MLPTIEYPGLSKYRVDFPAGHTVFTEGDDSRDLYILIKGSLDVLKGAQTIARIIEPGTLFGEMSFFLDAARTSTVRTATGVAAYRIPRDHIAAFLQEFPDVVIHCVKILAERLEKTSSVLYGLKELCDRLPDAVVICDRDGRLLSWNSTAEALYGIGRTVAEQTPAEMLYADPEAFRAYVRDVQHHRTVRERVFALLSSCGARFVSVSATLLFDGHHQVRGFLSLSRDVTGQQVLARRYRRIRKWLVAPLLAAAVLVVAVLYGYPYFMRGRSAAVLLHETLHSRIARDYLTLNTLLAAPFTQRDREKTSGLLRDFFSLQSADRMPYTGIVLLDGEKKVFDAYAPRGGSAGMSYAGITFPDIGASLHSVVTVYRTDRHNPMGAEQTEVVFPLAGTPGWLVLQMDMRALKDVYGADAATLRSFRFAR